MKKTLTAMMVLLLGWVTVPLSAQKRPKTPATGRQSVVAQGESKQGERPQPASATSPFLIGAADVLDITVWKEPNFSRTVPVRSDGKISMPLLNDLQAAGLTPMELGDSITERLRKYVTDPQVTVTVMVINSQRVFIMGEVTRPGPVSWVPDMTVLQALSVAGGFTQYANRKRIYALRAKGGKQTRLAINYREAILGNPKQNFLLIPGDTIVIP